MGVDGKDAEGMGIVEKRTRSCGSWNGVESIVLRTKIQRHSEHCGWLRIKNPVAQDASSQRKNDNGSRRDARRRGVVEREPFAAGGRVTLVNGESWAILEGEGPRPIRLRRDDGSAGMCHGCHRSVPS